MLTQPKTKNQDTDRIARDILDLDTTLHSHIPSTLWISDLHGAGERFKQILKGRFGMVYQTCVEALPPTFAKDKINHLSRIIRYGGYMENPSVPMDRQDIIQALVQVLSYKMKHSRYRLRDAISEEFLEVISQMVSGVPVSHLVYENDIIAERIISHLSQGIKAALLDRIIVLGDIFDRGPQPDMIVRILSSYNYRHIVRLIFGNHDILWMGAAAGNPSLIAEAMRITCRYDHFEFLTRMGIRFDKLEKFALKNYPDNRIKGKFKAKTYKGRAMEKALSVMQFKLEDQTIRRHPEYEMDARLWMDRLAEMLKSGDTEGLLDTHFPTIDLNDPAKLSNEEEEVMSDLIAQFTGEPKLKRIMEVFFRDGHTYYVHNNILNIHALVPSTEEGELDTLMGHKGKALLDYVQETIKRVGRAYIKGGTPDRSDSDFFFYLWCGPRSPFFGKQAMKTFERYFIEDKALQKEVTLYWERNLQKDSFKKKILEEFNAKRVVYGHTPRDYSKGQKIASDDAVAINIDGGFSDAYFSRGHALVQTPYQLYGIILPTPDEIRDAHENNVSIPLTVEIIAEYPRPLKVMDTQKGGQLSQRKKELQARLESIK